MMSMRKILAAIVVASIAIACAVIPQREASSFSFNSNIGHALLAGTGSPPVTLSVSNGTVSNDGTYVTFNSDDVLLASAPFFANVLVVPGGAGGGTGCGGGAGRPQLFTNVLLGTQTPILLGLGGHGSTGGVASSPGTASYVWPNTAASTAFVSTGGAATGTINQNGPSWLTGSGAGVCSASTGGPNYSGGTGEGLSNENPGGGTTTIASPFSGGGAGGAGGPGGGVSVAGHAGQGGPALPFTIGSLTANYAAGGNGTCFSNGGVGCTNPAAPLGAGTPGSGGNGAFSAATGQNGFSGTVIVAPIGVKPVWGTKTVQPSASCVSFANAPTMYLGVIKLCGWSGNCAVVTRSSDSTTLAIGFVNNVCDWQSADQFAGATNSTLTITTWYDESGNGFDATCTGTAAAGFGAPGFSSLNTWNGIRPVSFEGQGTADYQYCSNATITGNTNAVTILQIVNPRTSADIQGYWALQNSALTSYYSTLFSNAGSDLRLATPGISGIDTGFYPPVGPQAIAVSSSGTTGQVVQVGSTQFTSASNTNSQAFGAIRVGVGNNGSVTAGIFDQFVFALWNQTSTAPQVSADATAAIAPLNLSSQPACTYNAVYGGSSLITSYFSTLNQEAPWQAGFGKGTNGPMPTWCGHLMAVAGRSLAVEYTQRTLYQTFYNASYAKNVVIIDAPSNDIDAFTCTSQANCQTQADTLFTGTAVPFIQALQGYGFQVVVPTTIARGAFTTANFLEYARLEYDADVIANAATYGYTVSDRANSTIDAPAGAFNTPAATNDTTRYAGTTHLFNLGYLTLGLTDRLAFAGF